MISRRAFITRITGISSTGLALIGCGAGSGRTLSQTSSQELLRMAAEHVRLAEGDRGRSALWGRVGGSSAEHASARLFDKQIKLIGVIRGCIVSSHHGQPSRLVVPSPDSVAVNLSQEM